MRLCPVCVIVPSLALGLGLLALLGGAGRAPSPAPAPALADAYEVDPVHSSAFFKVTHMGVSHFYGRFDKIAGSFNLDAAAPDKSALEVTIETDSVDTNAKKRDDHLKTADFFSAKEFPTLSFKATAFKKTGDKSFDVTGDLTIHGVKKSVTVKVDQTGSNSGPRGSMAGIETIFTIKRSDYGMTKMLEGVSDEVAITVALEGGKK